MGILANSASKTMVSSSSDAVADGFVTHERIVLTTSTTGTDYLWGMSAPMGSALSRSTLSSYVAASPTFIPDVGGIYVLSCLVDSTQYVLRLSVTSTAIAQNVEATRFSPKADTTVPAPASGATLFYSSTQDAMCLKYPDGSIKKITTTAVP